jgi:hypothetical protein
LISRTQKAASSSKNAADERARASVESTASNGNDEASTSTAIAAPPSTSHILDPSLFAASFSKKKDVAASRTDHATQPSVSLTKNSKKRFGMVKGRDGQPMKRLKDGQTTIRVLQAHKPARVEASTTEEILPRPALIEPSQVLPNAKIRAFRKQKLGLKQKATEVEHASTQAKSLRSEEDPLGLQDPAFMKGGELEGLGLPAKRKRSTSKPSIRDRGGRTKCEMKRRALTL